MTSWTNDLTATLGKLKKGDKLQKDPWVGYLHSRAAFTSLSKAQKEAIESLGKVWQEIEQEDKQRAEVIQSSLRKYLTGQQTAESKVQQDLSIAIHATDAVSPQDWNDFLRLQALTPTSGPFSTSSPSSVPVTHLPESHSVIRVGQLEISGLLRWKSYFFTLTAFGFLHYFASSQVR